MRAKPDFKILSIVSVKSRKGSSYCNEIDFCRILVNKIT